MFKQHTDSDRSIVFLICNNEVRTTDLAGHRRAAIGAARNLGRPFVVATDLTQCSDISSPAAEELCETVRHLEPFGLASELRLVSEGTPETVIYSFDDTGGTFPVDVLTVPSRDAVGSAVDEHLEPARC